VLEPSDLDPSSVFEILAKALPDTLNYEWDDQFGGVLAAFDAASKDQILSIVSAQLGQGSDNSTINRAPPASQTLSKSLAVWRRDSSYLPVA
jgi:hypothetical protein